MQHRQGICQSMLQCGKSSRPDLGMIRRQGAGMMMTDTMIEARNMPVQRRSRERIDNIVNAAAALLAEMPADDITMTLIAARVDIPVSSVYRYFANINAIYHALFESISAEQDRLIIDIMDDTAARPSWRERFSVAINVMRDAFDEHPCYRQLLSAILARHELTAQKEQFIHGVAAHMAARWRAGKDGFKGGDPDIVARLTMQIFLSIEAYMASVQEPKEREQIFEQLALNLECYLAQHLSDQEPA